MIVEEEQGGDITLEYGRKLYLELAKRLTKKMGKLIPIKNGDTYLKKVKYPLQENFIDKFIHWICRKFDMGVEDNLSYRFSKRNKYFF